MYTITKAMPVDADTAYRVSYDCASKLWTVTQFDQQRKVIHAETYTDRQIQVLVRLMTNIESDKSKLFGDDWWMYR